MPGKIFYRERRTVKDGEKKPRYRVVGVSGCDLKVYCYHLRMAELKQISEDLGAELITLRRGPKHT